MNNKLNEKLKGKDIIVICEGNSEETIFKMLLYENKLLIHRDQLVNDENNYQIRAGKSIESEFLTMEFENEVVILRILDSKNEKFKLSKEYKENVKEVIDIITSPEIEMLIVFSEDKYDEYVKSRKKPSVFCKEKLKLKKVKNAKFIESYYSDVDKLLKAIKIYHKKTTKIPNKYTLNDLLI